MFSVNSTQSDSSHLAKNKPVLNHNIHVEVRFLSSTFVRLFFSISSDPKMSVGGQRKMLKSLLILQMEVPYPNLYMYQVNSVPILFQARNMFLD